MNTTETIKVVYRLLDSYEDFSFRLLSKLTNQDADKNLCISPFSIAIALMMTYNGARGITEKAIAKTLGLAEITLESANAANKLLLSMGENIDSQVQLAVANSIWVSQGINLAADFIKRIKDFYAGVVANLNFSEPEAAKIINNWVADKTQQKITNLLTSDTIRTAILILINAVYFKGTWTKEFDKNRTENRTFTLIDGSSKQHPMMFQSGSYLYYENKHFQAVSLPYGKGNVSMYIFLPKPSFSIREFQTLLDVDNWQNWIDQFYQAEGNIILPRFKVEYEKTLNDSLIALGMGAAFGNANFEGMGAGELVISKVIHKTFIEVNEEGTEAAAATAVIMTRGLSNKFSMVIERPFFYAIRDNQTGILLFMGFVLNPV